MSVFALQDCNMVKTTAAYTADQKSANKNVNGAFAHHLEC